MKRFFKAHWPLFIAAGVYLALAGFMFLECSRAGGGRFVYPLDDAYIHLAHGRSFGLHGTWGVTAHEFSSSTSSLLWTLLLAGWCRVAGPWELAPLALNLLCGLALIGVLHGWMRKIIQWQFAQLIALIFFVLIVPLPVLAISGMEHTLQVLLTVLFLIHFQKLVGATAESSTPSGSEEYSDMTPDSAPLRSAPSGATHGGPLRGPGEAKGEAGAGPMETRGNVVPGRGDHLPGESQAGGGNVGLLALLAALMVMSRYESLFLIAFAGFFLILTRRWKSGLLLWAAAWVPVLAYGVFSLRHGAWLLPNTLLIKGNVPSGVLETLKHVSAVLQINMPVYVLMLLAAAAWSVNLARRWPRQGEHTILILTFLGAAALHALFAQFGYLYRYEAYLIATGFFVLVGFLFTFPFELEAAPPAGRLLAWCAGLCLWSLVLIPFEPRMVDSVRYTPQASRNIHVQQGQMARFVKRFYPGRAVALNDIGLVSWLAEPRLFDMWGLATQPVADARRKKEYTRERVTALTRARGVELALIYDSWFPDNIPADWIKVGEWSILNNYICANATVSIYAADPRLAPQLREQLRSFAPSLPWDVEQRGAFPGKQDL